MRSIPQVTLLLASTTCALACTPGPATTTDQPTSSSTTDATATDATTTSDAPTTTEATTTTSETTGEPTSSSTTGAPAGYCWGLDDDAPAPFLELYDFDENLLAEGVTLSLECGSQGLWMFGLYPRFGGYDPMSDSVSFSVTVDVEGYNINPAGHFFSGDVGYYVGCEDLIGGVFGVVPVLPPDELADPGVLDGLTATVHVELATGAETLTFDATMPLSAPMELTEQGCSFGP